MAVWLWITGEDSELTRRQTTRCFQLIGVVSKGKATSLSQDHPVRIMWKSQALTPCDRIICHLVILSFNPLLTLSLQMNVKTTTLRRLKKLTLTGTIGTIDPVLLTCSMHSIELSRLSSESLKALYSDCRSLLLCLNSLNIFPYTRHSVKCFVILVTEKKVIQAVLIFNTGYVYVKEC
jgi:hypothetical protein